MARLRLRPRLLPQPRQDASQDPGDLRLRDPDGLGDLLLAALLVEPQEHDAPVAVVEPGEERLQDHARKLTGRTKHHDEAPLATIQALGADHGFLSTPDGRQLYFHANSVLDRPFDELTVGTRVVFVEEDGIEGPQASTIRVVA